MRPANISAPNSSVPNPSAPNPSEPSLPSPFPMSKVVNNFYNSMVTNGTIITTVAATLGICSAAKGYTAGVVVSALALATGTACIIKGNRVQKRTFELQSEALSAIKFLVDDADDMVGSPAQKLSIISNLFSPNQPDTETETDLNTKE